MAIVYDTSRSPVEGSFFPPRSHSPIRLFSRFNLFNPKFWVRSWAWCFVLRKAQTAQQAFTNKAFTPVPML